MKIIPFVDRLSEIVRELESKGITKSELQERSGLYPQFMDAMFNFGQIRGVRFGTLEKLASSLGRLPLIFYTENAQLENLGLKGFPNEGLPDNYIGRVFEKHRKQLRLTPKKVAYKSKCLLQKYLEYESGASKPNIYALERISSVLELVPLYLPEKPQFPPKKAQPDVKTIIDGVFQPVMKALESYGYPLPPEVAAKVVGYIRMIYPKIMS